MPSGNDRTDDNLSRHRFVMEEVTLLSRRHDLAAYSHVRAAEPFLLVKEMAEWPFFQRFSCLNTAEAKLRSLASAAPNRIIQYAYLRGVNRQFTYTKGAHQRLRMVHGPLARFVETCARSKNSTYYMQAQQIPEIAAGIPEMSKLHCEGINSPMLFWLGNSGQQTSLHNDRFRNFIAVFLGVKRVYLFPPEALSNLYIAPLDRCFQGALTSLVNPISPDNRKFPLFQMIAKQMRVVDVHEGEILYIPPLWWHLVSANGGLNLSANIWAEEVECAPSLYLPRALRLMDTEIPGESLETRRKLRHLFHATLSKSTIDTLCTGSLARTVTKTALDELQTLRSIVDEDLRARWAGWVGSLLDHLVFQLQGDPFPTLTKGEFYRMVSRMRTSSLSGS
ncbi:Cupin-like domain-containing protein [Nitrosospira multiformis]|uniref:Cupin-like domain-containing protein n=1 Tax=Nitrosospira multiformis TaxID=1231 RepID=A0A1H8MK79_9PROT|nr:cupin-like domain-containing protein [Nitrosospira multiformis]SEO17680.1 Cupin-like domain-containing protein [Nitrosospira multiformis]